MLNAQVSFSGTSKTSNQRSGTGASFPLRSLVYGRTTLVLKSATLSKCVKSFHHKMVLLSLFLAMALHSRRGLSLLRNGRDLFVSSHIQSPRAPAYTCGSDLYSPTLKEYIQNHWTGIALYLAQTENHIPFRLPVTFNISFLVNAQPFCLMETAVGDISDLIKSNPEASSVKWLFPTVKNFTDTPPRWIRDSTHEVLKWKDKDLNEEQKASMSPVERGQPTDE